MIMADVFKILFLILGMLICTVSYWLLFSALFPPAVQRTQQALRARPIRITLTGVLLGLPAVLVAFVLAANGAGPLKLLGVVGLMALVCTGLFGSTGLVRMVGQGLGNPQMPVSNGKLVLRGGSVVAIAFVLPLIGWFFVLPLVLFTGLGASIHLLRERRSTVPAEVPGVGALHA